MLHFYKPLTAPRSYGKSISKRLDSYDNCSDKVYCKINNGIKKEVTVTISADGLTTAFIGQRNNRL